MNEGNKSLVGGGGNKNLMDGGFSQMGRGRVSKFSAGGEDSPYPPVQKTLDMGLILLKCLKFNVDS